jgi:RNA polymerase primary sigma factor/RNA polymerase nonessential primary-like sigma factor
MTTSKPTAAVKKAAAASKKPVAVKKPVVKKPVVKKTTVTKKAPAKTIAPKKVAAKKVPAKKVPAKKAAPAKKIAVKKTPAKAPAKKVAAKKATAKKTAAKKAPSKALATTTPPRATAKAITPKKNLPAPGKSSTDVQDEVIARVPLSGDQWNDKNRELFLERIRIADELALLEAVVPEERTLRMRQKIARLRQEHNDITYKIYYDNYGLLRNYVRKFSQNASREDIADFEGAATVGLMRAITSYDPSKGRFAQWAFKPMQREVLRAVHSADHPNMNAGDFEKRPDILRAMRQLQNGDESARPSMEAIAAEAGVTVDQTKRVLQAPHLESIYTPMGDGTTTLGEMLSDETESLEDNVITRLGIKDLENFGLKELDPRELFVIIRRQGLDCEPKQRLNSIGATLGLSREAVRQIESRARGKLAHPVILRKLARQGRD